MLSAPAWVDKIGKEPDFTGCIAGRVFFRLLPRISPPHPACTGTGVFTNCFLRARLPLSQPHGGSSTRTPSGEQRTPSPYVSRGQHTAQPLQNRTRPAEKVHGFGAPRCAARLAGAQSARDMCILWHGAQRCPATVLPGRCSCREWRHKCVVSAAICEPHQLIPIGYDLYLAPGRVVSTASWAPPRTSSPLAITSAKGFETEFRDG